MTALKVEQWQKRPVVIEATEPFSGFGPDRNGDAIIDWIAAGGGEAIPEGDQIRIATLEGDHFASVGDRIIRGVAREHYPCKPDIFDATYQRPS